MLPFLVVKFDQSLRLVVHLPGRATGFRPRRWTVGGTLSEQQFQSPEATFDGHLVLALGMLASIIIF
jgi:hypothetical protein